MNKKIFGILSALLFISHTGCAHADNSQLQISEMLFPQTKSWQDITGFSMKKPELDKIKGKLKEAYMAGKLANPASYHSGESEGCSFINRVLGYDKEVDTTEFGKSFYSVDVNSDGKKDVIYTGDNPCAEGKATVTWLSDGKDNFTVPQDRLFQLAILKFLPQAEPQVVSIAQGCCDDPMDEYAVGEITFNPWHLGSKKTYKEVVLPKQHFAKGTDFTAHKPITLRSSPLKDDAYSEGQSIHYDHAVFGNIQSRYIAGAKGAVWAKQKDKKGNEWAFVVINESGEFKTDDVLDSKIGWVSMDELQK